MSVRIIVGDALDQLRLLPDDSVHCCVTSPPYYGLRDYGVERQIGLEPSPDEYVAALVEVFREVRRVLRNDGTLWLNIGDSYAREGGKTPNVSRHWDGRKDDPGGLHDKRTLASEMGLKPKDLIGIPWMLAFALRADGWYLRQDIIWSKPNPMPESVTDRCTKAHEYLFLLSKSARYYYNADAIREVHQDMNGTERFSNGGGTGERHDNQGWAGGKVVLDKHRNYNLLGRNKHSVWTVATQPYPDAHFATFPPALIESCIKAGTSAKGCCAKCGAQWLPMTDRIDQGYDGSTYGERVNLASGGVLTGGTAKSTLGSGNGKLVGKKVSMGWQAACSCNAETIPSTVLEPFAGSGTTGMVAWRHGRDAILIEINPEYAKLSRQRILKDAGAIAKLFGNPVVI